MVTYQAEVIIIGGGATGVGLLRDLSMRGVTMLLLEQGDLAHGTSSRFHGFLQVRHPICYFLESYGLA